MTSWQAWYPAAWSMSLSTSPMLRVSTLSLEPSSGIPGLPRCHVREAAE
jgi:hypothetical protein